MERARDSGRTIGQTRSLDGRADRRRTDTYLLLRLQVNLGPVYKSIRLSERHCLLCRRSLATPGCPFCIRTGSFAPELALSWAGMGPGTHPNLDWCLRRRATVTTVLILLRSMNLSLTLLTLADQPMPRCLHRTVSRVLSLVRRAGRQSAAHCGAYNSIEEINDIGHILT